MFPAASNATLLACPLETPFKVCRNDPSGLYQSTAPCKSGGVPSSSSATNTSSPVGGGDVSTVNALALVAVPPDVVTRSGPVVAPVGTVARMVVAELTVKLVALTPLNVTAVAPVKFVPVIVTVLPTGPLVGVKLVIVGAFETVTVTEAEVVVLPAASRARAVRGWDPS